MKIEKLTENKIRIVLNIDELIEKNIDLQLITKDTNLAQKLFKKILKQAEKEIGFNTTNSKLLIEAFISNDGFFIITFTKISDKIKTKVTKNDTLKIKKKISIQKSKTAIYEFNNFDDFCNFSTYLNNFSNLKLKNIAKKILLYEYKNKYFLVLSDINSDFNDLILFYNSISEFAKLISTSSYLNSEFIEYGKIILKNPPLK